MTSEPDDEPDVIPFGADEIALLASWNMLLVVNGNLTHDGQWHYYSCSSKDVQPGIPGFTYELFGRRVEGPQSFPPTLEVYDSGSSTFYAVWNVRVYLGDPAPSGAPFIERTSQPDGTYVFRLGGWADDQPPNLLQVQAVHRGAPALSATRAIPGQPQTERPERNVDFDEIMAAARLVGLNAVNDKTVSANLKSPMESKSSFAKKKRRAGLSIEKIKQLLRDEQGEGRANYGPG